MPDLFVAEPPHVCQTPIRGQRNWLHNVAARQAGSVWKCDICGRIWECYLGLLGLYWWDPSEATVARFATDRATRTGGGS